MKSLSLMRYPGEELDGNLDKGPAQGSGLTPGEVALLDGGEDSIPCRRRRSELSACYSEGAGLAVSGGPTASLGPDSGSSTVKIEPRPGSLCTEMVPSSASTMVRQI